MQNTTKILIVVLIGLVSCQSKEERTISIEPEEEFEINLDKALTSYSDFTFTKHELDLASYHEAQNRLMELNDLLDDTLTLTSIRVPQYHIALIEKYELDTINHILVKRGIIESKLERQNRRITEQNRKTAIRNRKIIMSFKEQIQESMILHYRFTLSKTDEHLVEFQEALVNLSETSNRIIDLGINEEQLTLTDFQAQFINRYPVDTIIKIINRHGSIPKLTFEKKDVIVPFSEIKHLTGWYYTGFSDQFQYYSYDRKTSFSQFEYEFQKNLFFTHDVYHLSDSLYITLMSDGNDGESGPSTSYWLWVRNQEDLKFSKMIANGHPTYFGEVDTIFHIQDHEYLLYTSGIDGEGGEYAVTLGVQILDLPTGFNNIFNIEWDNEYEYEVASYSFDSMSRESFVLKKIPSGNNRKNTKGTATSRLYKIDSLILAN